MASRSARDRARVAGVRRRAGALVALAATLALAATASVSRADALSDAQAAFDRGEIERAAELWRELARSGEPEAAFRLGLLHDLGLGPAPDPTEAFGRYLQAAHEGHAAAQFNVGVMLDAGTGPLWSPSAAATWYARSASKGLARAQYNLALLYADGDGLPRNTGLARAWMRRAADTLPAAAERLESLDGLEPETPTRPSAPLPIAGSVVRLPGGERALELVWTAAEQPLGTGYRVELDDAGRPGDAEPIPVSAVTLPPPAGNARRWRVVATRGEDAVASDWQPLSGAERASATERTIAIRFASDDTRARALAAELADGFAAERGADAPRVAILAVAESDIDESEIRYFSADDAAFAREVAEALPALAARTVLRADESRDPGTVEVRLRGEPSP